MKNIKFSLIKILVITLIATSCNDILDEAPDNRTTIDSSEKIAELLVAAYPEAGYVAFLEPMSDNADDKGLSETTEFRVNKKMYFWQDIDETDGDTPTNYWNGAYEAISQANQALVSIEELGGGSELNYLKGEALICRAYAHFMLVNIFSKAYNSTTAPTDIGIPYISKPENILLGDYERGNVDDVYANIKKDIEEGLPLITDDYGIPAFHFTKKAANAFAARFYLTIGEWQKVIDYSSVALGSNVLGVLRDINTSSDLTFNDQTALYTSSSEPANLLLVSAVSSYNRMDGIAQYQFSPKITNQNFRNNITGKRWSYSIFSRGGSNNNLIPKFQEYFRITNQAANTGFPFVTYVLFSTDEAILNRAEAYAMLGQYENATTDINASLALKTSGYDSSTDTLTPEDISGIYANLDANLHTPYYQIPTSALPFVAAVLDIKRTVLYNEGLRWFDIKRHDIEIEHLDVFNNNNILPKGDNRRALQIPEAAQSHGIQENPRN